MTRNELIQELKKKFNIRELVCEHCYNKFKNNSWQFLSTELLSTLYKLRFEIFNAPITINTWHIGGTFSQRGLRCNMCNIPKNKTDIYLSAHCLGYGVDFNVKGYTAEQARNKIKENIDLLDYPIRLERDTSWIHIDCYQPYESENDIVEFNG